MYDINAGHNMVFKSSFYIIFGKNSSIFCKIFVLLFPKVKFVIDGNNTAQSDGGTQYRVGYNF